MKRKQIFVIGRMGENYIERLNRLAFDIIKPVAEPLGYTVHTPNKTGGRNIMHDVVEMLETSEIVVADITSAGGEGGETSANVLYELGIRHCFGSPYIAVTETMNKVPFDIRGHRVLGIDLDNIPETIQKISLAISNADKKIGTFNNSNPVVDYYGESLTSISPAVGIALGYFVNFIRPAVSKLTQINAEHSEYEFDIILKENNKPDARIIKTLGRDFHSRKNLKIHIAIPPNLGQIDGTSLEQIVAKELDHGALYNSPRAFTIYLKELPYAGMQIFDFPRPLTAIKLALENRLGTNEFGSERWKELERNEIQLFCSELKRYVKSLAPPHHQHIRIHQYVNQNTPEPIKWLRNYWAFED